MRAGRGVLWDVWRGKLPRQSTHGDSRRLGVFRSIHPKLLKTQSSYWDIYPENLESRPIEIELMGLCPPGRFAEVTMPICTRHNSSSIPRTPPQPPRTFLPHHSSLYSIRSPRLQKFTMADRLGIVAAITSVAAIGLGVAKPPYGSTTAADIPPSARSFEFSARCWPP